MPSSNLSPEIPGQNIAVSQRNWKTTFNALGDRNFRWFWIGSVSSFFSGQMQQPAQAWLAYELTNSPFKLGLVMAVQAIPMLLLSLYSGVIIDRVQKRTIIIAYQICNSAVALAVAVLISAGIIQYWHLLAASFLNGVGMAFYLPARNAIIAELVSRDKIYNAVALNNVGSNIAQIAGPALSGILIAVIGAQGAYYIGVVFTIIAAGVFSLLAATSRPAINSDNSIFKNWKAGLGYIRVHNIIIMLLVIEFVVTIFGMSFQSLMPVFAKLLNQESEGYGFMLSAIGIGALVGSLFIASLGNFKQKGLVLLITCTVFGIMLILFATSGMLGETLGIGTGSVYIATLWLVIIGIASNAFLSTNNTLIQMSVNSEFRGRINGVYGMVIGLYPVGMLLAGTAAEYLGAPSTVILSGSFLALFMVMMLIFSRRVRKLE